MATDAAPPGIAHPFFNDPVGGGGGSGGVLLFSRRTTNPRTRIFLSNETAFILPFTEERSGG